MQSKEDTLEYHLSECITALINLLESPELYRVWTKKTTRTAVAKGHLAVLQAQGALADRKAQVVSHDG
jgi:hypothetical protein